MPAPFMKLRDYVVREVDSQETDAGTRLKLRDYVVREVDSQETDAGTRLKLRDYTKRGTTR